MYTYREERVQYQPSIEPLGRNVDADTIERVTYRTWTAKTVEGFIIDLDVFSVTPEWKYQVRVTKPSGYVLISQIKPYGHEQLQTDEFALDLLEHLFGFTVYIEEGEE